MRLYRPGNTVANRYEVQDVLGIGPVSATYLVREQEGHELLALKVINSELTISEPERESCANAIRKISEARHPSLREIHEVDAQGPVVFYTSSHHINGSLRGYLRAQPLMRFSDVEGIIHQLCRALADLSLAHGGLRPENVMLSAGSVRLSDLGLCAALPKSAYVGALRQEPARFYLAPELLQNLEPTPTSDVFSLGVLCIELLTGQLHPSNSPVSIAKKLRVNESLDELLQSALSIHSSSRIETPQEFAAKLSQVSRLTVFVPKSVTLNRAELLQKLKGQEAASEPEPTPKPLAALKQTVKTTETVKTAATNTTAASANAKTAEIPRPTDPAKTLTQPKTPETKPNERLASPSIPLPKIPMESPTPRPPEPKPIAKTTEFPKANKPESKINIPIPKPPMSPMSPMRLSTGEQEIVRSARFPESKINIPIRPDPPKPPTMRMPEVDASKSNRPTESPSKSMMLKPEPPKVERAPSAPGVRSLTGEQELVKPRPAPALKLSDEAATDQPTPSPRPKPTIPPSELPHDPEPTQVSAKLPEAFVALLAAEQSASNEGKTTQPIDPALLLLRPFDSMPRSSDPYLFSKTSPISSKSEPRPLNLPLSIDSGSRLRGNELGRNIGNDETRNFQNPAEPPKAPEPTVSTRMQDVSDAPKLPEPTSVYVKNPDKPSELSAESHPQQTPEHYPSIDSVDLFVDVEEIEEEDPLNPFADDIPQKSMKPWPRPDTEDSETTGIRPLPSRRTPALPMQDPGDDLFSSYPEPPPFDPSEEK